MHPLAQLNNKSGFDDVQSGDKVVYRFDNRTGILDEALSDGDAFVTWDDGTHDTVKWNHLSKLDVPVGEACRVEEISSL